MPNWLWPSIQDYEDSRKAAAMGCGTAILCGVATAAITLFHGAGHSLIPGWTSYAYIDAVIFLIVGAGIWRMSRIAALAGVVIYVLGQVTIARSVMAQGGHYNPVLAIFFTINFINGIRGTFAFHELKKGGASESEEMESKKAMREESGEAEETRAKQKRARIIFAVILLAVAGYLVYANFGKIKSQVTGSKNGSIIPFTKAKQTAVQESAPAVSKAPPAGSLDFKMKSGKKVRGSIVYEDEVYYTVDTGGGEEIIIKEDLASPPS